MIPGSANPLLLKSAAAAAGGYQVSRSLRFNSADSAFLSRTPAVAGDRRTWTWAAWVKRSALGTSQMLLSVWGGYATELTIIQFNSDDTLMYYFDNAANNYRFTTSQVFRDCSSWYHVVIAVDTTQAVNTNRAKLYVNGSQVTTFSQYDTFPPNYYTFINSTNTHNIGRYSYDGTRYFSGYLAECYLIDGQQLTSSSFTEVSATTGQLIPLAYSGTFGTNGFWLKFSDNSALTSGSNVGVGKDYSGNANYFNTSGLSVTAGAGNDSLVDTPTSIPATDTGVGGEVRGNYATLNPLAGTTFGALSDGNLKHTASGGNFSRKISTIGVASGKWYAEFTFETAGDNTNQCGVLSFLPPVDANNQNGEENGSGIYNGDNGGNNGTIIINGTKVLTGQTVSGSGTIIGVALDADSNNVKFYRNGTIIGSSSGYTPTNVSGTWYFVSHTKDGSNANVINAGQRAFAYTAPSGFKALCDTNLGAPVVAKPNQHFDAITYTGNGSTLTIPNVNSTPTSIAFDPGFIWFKQRASPKRDNNVYDVIRGTTKLLSTNGTSGDASTYDVYPGTGSEQTVSGLTAFNTGSKTVDVGSSNVANGSSSSYVAWAWYAGATTDPSNQAGSITSQVRANVSAGFSVVTYTGTGSAATVGHGLGIAPSLIICKVRNTSDNWCVYHASIGASLRLNLNTTAGTTSGTAAWGTTPTSTVFSIGTSGEVNTNSNTFVAYCFAPVVGYSSFGSYTGNGSADGPFIFTSFRPRWVLFKNTNSGENWRIMDAARNTYNVANSILYPNLSNSEGSSAVGFDILSNGFKIRETGSELNASGVTIIYAAFAENPFQYARAR